MKSVAATAVIAALILAACNVIMGPLNQDEGWYLLAGLNTASGMMPYRDYFYSQTPVLPYVYAFTSPLWAPLGVLGGRLFTAALGLLSACLCAGFAWRVSNQRTRGLAALCAWLLTACCPVYSYFTAIPKTYALAALLVCGAFFVLAGKKRWRFELCGILLALACGTRASLGILLAFVGFGLLLMRRRDGCKFAWLRFGAAGAITLAAVFAPFMITESDGFAFSQSMHASRGDVGSMEWLMLRAGAASRLVQGYFMTFVLAAFALAYGGTRGLPSLRRAHPAIWLALAGWIAAAAAHFLAPFPYDDYQTPIMPLAAAVVSAFFADAVEESRLRHTAGTAWTVLCLAVLFMGASPLAMNWVSVRQDRFWVVMKEKPDVMKLREVGKWLHERTGENDLILTQDAYVAVEARRRVPDGLEVGPFSLYPAISAEEAAAAKVHNVETLRRLIETTDAPYAVLSGYSFAISAPEMAKTDQTIIAELDAAIRRRYKTVEIIPDFGQQHTTLEILELTQLGM